MSQPQTELIRNRLQAREALKLSDADTIKFLELYGNEKLLYDMSMDEYRNRDLRMAAAKRIADVMNIPGFGIAQVLKKFKNLRNGYSQELKKIEDNEFYIPKVHWFSTMNSFLRRFIYQRLVAAKPLRKRRKLTRGKPISSPSLGDEDDINDEIQDHDEESVTHPGEAFSNSSNFGDSRTQDIIVLDKSLDSHDADYDDDYDEGITDNDSVNRSTAGSFLQVSRRKRRAVNKTKKSNVTADPMSAVRETPTHCGSTTTAEDIEIFGKSVASHLRQLPLQIALEAQRFITDYLIKTRLEHMNDVPTTPSPVAARSAQPLPSVANATAISCLRPATPQSLELSCDSSDCDPVTDCC